MNPIQDYFTPKLKEGEKIIWSGKPKDGILIKDADMILIPVSIIMIGFSLFFDYILVTYSAPITLIPLGIMLTLGGVYLAFIRFYADAIRRKNILYCVTNKRVLRLTGSRHDKFQTLQLRDIENLDMTEEKDGSGFILFGTTNPLFPWLFGGFSPSKEKIPGLEFIPGVEAVFDIIQSAVKSSVDPLVIEKVKPDQRDLN